MYYLRSRYYTTQNNRFLNADGYLYEENLYSYCKNCPVSQVDPEGEFTASAFGDMSNDPINTMMADEMALGGGTWGALMRTLQSATKGLNMAMGQRNAFRTENHHLYSNKNKTYSLQYQEVMSRYDMSLNDPENIVPLKGHSGRHTKVYHEFMLHTLYIIDDIAGSDVDLFKEGLGIMRNFVINNPGLPYAK